MTSAKVVKAMDFIEYVLLYLEYMSYVNNKHKTQASERVLAAQIYYKAFITTIIPEDLEGRKVVEATILHVLTWCLSKEFKGDPTTFALIVFRLHDFLVVLDMGTS